VAIGDNLWRISYKYYGTGTRWREIYEVNVEAIGPDPNYLLIGQQLTIYTE